MLIKLKQKMSRSGFFNRLMQNFLPVFLKLRPLRHLMIEPTNMCNLRCLFCTQDESPRPKGMMKLEDFKKIVSFLPGSVEEVQLHFAGESVLNQDLPEMVSVLKNRGIKTILSTNGTLPFGFYKKIIDSGLDRLIVSFDGATKEVYEKYRQGGTFKKVTENIKKISEKKGRKTEIVIQFIVMRHNEDQVDMIKKLAGDLGVDTLWLKSASLNIGCSDLLQTDIIKNAKDFLPENLEYSRYYFKDGKLINKDKPLSCPWIFRTVVLWNGDVTVCCVDLDGYAVLGNVFKDGGLKKILTSKKYNDARKKILKNELKICKNCSIADNPNKEMINYR